MFFLNKCFYKPCNFEFKGWRMEKSLDGSNDVEWNEVYVCKSCCRERTNSTYVKVSKDDLWKLANGDHSIPPNIYRENKIRKIRNKE